MDGSDNGEQIGRTLSGTSYSLNHDYDGQCTSITGSSTTSFAYDAIGRRVSRTAGGATTNYQYAGDAVLLEKQGSTTTATYTYGNLLIRKDGETPLYDGLGTARAETNSSQAVTFTLNPDAFGNVVTTTGSTGSSYDFAATSGYRTDGDAGLMKVGCRCYDPQVGSFSTHDTHLDQKPYLYCEHDPVNLIDPDGHVPKWFRNFTRFIGGPLTGELEPPELEPGLPPSPPGAHRGPPPGWSPGGQPLPSGPGWKLMFKEVIDGGSKMLEPFQWIMIPPDMQRLGNRSGGITC